MFPLYVCYTAKWQQQPQDNLGGGRLIVIFIFYVPDIQFYQNADA